MLLGWPETNRDNDADRVWADVTRHCRDWRSMAVAGDLVSTAHEATHGANAEIRNARGGGVNAFYLLDDTAVVSPEPAFRKSAVAAFVPPAFRGDRFSTYVTGQGGWDDRPLYIWDEWVAYVNGALAAADLHDRGEYRGGWADWAMGPLEFNVYGLAAMAAAREHDPGGYAALKDDFAVLWGRGWRAHYRAAVPFPWDRQSRYRDAVVGLGAGPLADALADMGLYVPDRIMPPDGLRRA